jgi:hypothetical protein
MADYSDTEKGCYTQHGVSGYGVAVKLSRKESMNTSFVKTMAEEMMLSVADKCVELGARCIGHIKSHVKTASGTVKADTIGVAHGAHSSGHLEDTVRDLYMAVNSIVQGIPEDAVKAATLEGIHEVADKCGLAVIKEKEHTYFDEFDFVASKQEYLRQLEAQLEDIESDDTTGDKP